MVERLEIRGGVDQEQAAAIAAIVARIEADELAAAAVRPHRIHASQWIRAGRPLDRIAPVPPEEFENALESHPNDPSS